LLADGLVERGHDVTLFAPEGSRTAAKLIEGPPPLGAERVGNVWDETFGSLMPFLRAGDVDVIHDHTGSVGSALGAMLGGEPPVVHTLHGPWSDEQRRHYSLIDDRVHLVAISESQRAENPDVRYADVVHNAIDVDAHPFGEMKEEWVLFLGRSSPDKGPDEAIEIARKAGLPLKMIVKRAEPGEQEFWEQRVAPLLGDDVEVLDELSLDEKTTILCHARALLFPIRWSEPFGLVMIEAMACGTPVVGRPMGAASEVVADGTTGFLRETTDQMAEALLHVDRIDPRACRARVEERFSPSVMVAGYERVFEQVLAHAA
jgi:glycosyltransferase involved in cell wall biosynthesis